MPGTQVCPWPAGACEPGPIWHRDRNVDLRRNAASTLKSKQARILDKRKKIKMKGSLQPVRISIFETFCAVARRTATQSTAQTARFGSIHSGVLTERGMAAMLVQRNTKNCEVTASKQCILVEDEFENWMKQQFQAVGRALELVARDDEKRRSSPIWNPHVLDPSLARGRRP
eukprot:g28872.t1